MVQQLGHLEREYALRYRHPSPFVRLTLVARSCKTALYRGWGTSCGMSCELVGIQQTIIHSLKDICWTGSCSTVGEKEKYLHPYVINNTWAGYASSAPHLKRHVRSVRRDKFFGMCATIQVPFGTFSDPCRIYYVYLAGMPQTPW